MSRTEPWAASAAAVVGALDTNAESGLTGAEAARRLDQDGPNSFASRARTTRLRLVVDQFNNPIVWLLIVAAIVSSAVLDEWIDGSVIAAIVIINAVIGYVQENKAANALERLRDLAAPDAQVIRDGNTADVDARTVVAGDVVTLEAGDRVPADGRLLEEAALMVSEAALTGESYPVTKQATPVESATLVADRASMVFMGTGVQAGRAKAVVTATGNDTAMGEIAELLADEGDQETPLQADIRRLGQQLVVLTLGVAALIVVLGIIRDYEPSSIFLLAVALAVAAIPEGLPAVVTIVLANGVQAMARENAIVRRLPAVEALGSASVICTDKTGTVTLNEIRVQELANGSGPTSAESWDWDSPQLASFVQVAVLCNDAVAMADADGAWSGDPTEVALLELAAREVDIAQLREQYPRLDEAGFDSERMRMSTLHPFDNDHLLLAVKGAPERIIERSRSVGGIGETVAITDEVARRLREDAIAMARRGLRTLALALRVVPRGATAAPEDLEDDLTLVALVGMSDEIRPEVKGAVGEARSAGIHVVLITGDHRDTAEAVATEVGVLDGSNRVMTAVELHETPEESLGEAIGGVAVFARVEPRDKVTILEGWKQRGGIVAMTGDGVNDAPALQAADIGVAMGSGTDVAKDASDIVLVDDNFTTIVAAIREGRRIFTNLKKVVFFLLSANVSEVIVIALGILFFGHLGEPLLPTQILWMNLVTDGLPVLALGVDAAASDVMDQAPVRSREIIGRRQQGRIGIHGAILATMSLAVMVYGSVVLDENWDVVQTAVFSTLVFCQLAFALNVHAGRRSVWRAGIHNVLLVWALVISVGLQLLVLSSSVGHELFGTVTMPVELWVAIAAATVASLITVDLTKLVLGPFDR